MSNKTIIATSDRPLDKIQRLAIKAYLQSVYGADCKVMIDAPSQAEYKRQIKEWLRQNTQLFEICKP